MLPYKNPNPTCDCLCGGISLKKPGFQQVGFANRILQDRFILTNLFKIRKNTYDFYQATNCFSTSKIFLFSSFFPIGKMLRWQKYSAVSYLLSCTPLFLTLYALIRKVTIDICQKPLVIPAVLPFRIRLSVSLVTERKDAM